MNRNEQLLEMIGDISPIYIKEAMPGNALQKRRAQRIYLHKRSLIGMIAAMVSVSILMFILGLSAAAMTDRNAHAKREPVYLTGTLLTELPNILLPQEYEALLENMKKNLVDVPDGNHTLARFTMYYTLQSLSNQRSPKAKEGLLLASPLTQLTDIYTIDSDSLQMEEAELLAYWLTYYGEMTQERLIATRQGLHDVVDQSDLCEEEKQALHASLPAIPAVDPNAEPVTLEIGQKVRTENFGTGILPKVLTVADYEALVMQVLESVGATSMESAPPELQQMLASYQRYPLSAEPQDETQTFITEHLAPILEKTDVYVMDLSMTLSERMLLCHQLNRYASGWQARLEDYKNRVHDTLRPLCRDGEDYDARVAALYSLLIEYESAVRQKNIP